MTACDSLTSNSSRTSKLKVECFARFQPTQFFFLCHTALSTLFHLNWESRDKTTPEKSTGLNIGLAEDAILMTSLYRLNCLWPALLSDASYVTKIGLLALITLIIHSNIAHIGPLLANDASSVTNVELTYCLDFSLQH